MRNPKIWLSVFGIILVLSISFGAYFFFGDQLGAGVGCRLINSGVVTGSSFTCQGDIDDTCEVWGTGYCNDQSSSASVTFRTSDSDYNSGWIAVDINGDTQLDGLQFAKSTNSYSYSNLIKSGFELLNVKTPEGYFVGRCNPSRTNGCYTSNFQPGQYGVLMTTSTTGSGALKVYNAGSSNAITLGFPVQGYDRKETYSNFLFQCFPELKTGNGVVLKSASYTNNIAGTIPQTTKATIGAGTSVSFGKWNVNYEQYQCGTCGECVIGEKKCVSDTSYFECTADANGCGVKTISEVPVNQVCINDNVQACNDNNVCTNDVRLAGSSSCSFVPIANCCTKASDCDDNNACTTNSCGTTGSNQNRCVFTPQANCCTPSCDSNTEVCVNQKCELKKGCKYSNPGCTSPQTCDVNQNVDANTFGKCVCPTTSDYCGSDLFNTEKCQDNQIFSCIKDSSGLCNIWSLKETCGETEICI